jgi:hypothetical protein
MGILETLKDKVKSDIKNDIETVKAMINGDEKKTVEKFSDTSMIGGSMFHLILMFVAFVIAFRCNHNKMDVFSFLAACCCPYIYIPYKVVTSFDICLHPYKNLVEDN